MAKKKFYGGCKNILFSASGRKKNLFIKTFHRLELTCNILNVPFDRFFCWAIKLKRNFSS